MNRLFKTAVLSGALTLCTSLFACTSSAPSGDPLDRLKSTPSPIEDVPVITIDPTGTFPSGSNFDPKNTTATAGSQVTLQSAVSNLSAQVYTYDSGGTSINAFTSGSPPYNAPPGGTTYTLTATGTIVISLSSNGFGLTSNGTINVGGGG